MGMFDYVKVKENKLGIPAGEYQTKALNCYLDNYKVNENLELVCVKSDYEKDLPKKETFSKPIRLLHRETLEEVFVQVENGVITKVITKEDYNIIFHY